MADSLIDVGNGFYNIRGSFRIMGVVDIGTHMSLVRKADGRFVVLDGYTIDGAVAEQVMDLTQGGEAVDAVLHLHPFHTIHVKATYERFPKAKHYGTVRHKRKAPGLPWEDETTDSEAMHGLFVDDLSFSVPKGVDFIPDDENLHFASVLAVHRASKTLHVDDTLMFSKLPLVGGVSFHPTLKRVLQQRPGAVAEFREWAQELIALCEGVEHLCAAHTRPLLNVGSDGAPLAERVKRALKGVEGKLEAHEKAHG
ncbi:MAG: hypothetical protein AB8H79_26790 [Myxococcota bacterium]